MSNKPNTSHHDGTAINCVNHLAVIALGGDRHKPRRDRICMVCVSDQDIIMADSRHAVTYPADGSKPKIKRTRRRATREAASE